MDETMEKSSRSFKSSIYQMVPVYDLLIFVCYSIFSSRYVGGELNACYNAVDRHVEAGNGNKIAIIHDSPFTATVQKVSYGKLLDKVSHLAGALAKLGVRKGDRVLIYMPLIPETIMAMLATVRLGAVHSVVFGGKANQFVEFSPKIMFDYLRFCCEGAVP